MSPAQPSTSNQTSRRSHPYTTKHSDAASTSTVKPLSVNESYEGSFEKILDHQNQRLHTIYNKNKEIGALDKKNKAAFNDYKTLTKDNIDEIDETNSLLKDAEKLIKKLNITLISDFDSIKSLKKSIEQNIFIPENKSRQIWINSNSKLIGRTKISHQYLKGRILALTPVLNLKNPRLEPKELFEKINQAAIEKFFYCLELLITETDVKKELRKEEKKEQLYNMILLAFAQKFYSLKFSNWYENNKKRIEQLLSEQENNIDIRDLKKGVSMLQNHLSSINEELNQKTKETDGNHIYV